jgi:hypothetical protein
LQMPVRCNGSQRQRAGAAGQIPAHDGSESGRQVNRPERLVAAAG